MKAQLASSPNTNWLFANTSFASIPTWVPEGNKEVVKWGEMSQLTYDVYRGRPDINGLIPNAFADGGDRELNQYGLCFEYSTEPGGGAQVEYDFRSQFSIMKSIYTDARDPTSSKDTSWGGFIALQKPTSVAQDCKRDVVIVFRGTQGAKVDPEWASNYQIKLRNFEALPRGLQVESNAVHNEHVQVHTGFHAMYTNRCPQVYNNADEANTMSPRELIWTTLKQLRDEQVAIGRIVITGHSLGGALSTLAAYDIATFKWSTYDVAPELLVITFASPRVGNHAFAEHMDRIVPHYLRIANVRDLVTLTPLGWLLQGPARVLVNGMVSTISYLRGLATASKASADATTAAQQLKVDDPASGVVDLEANDNKPPGLLSHLPGWLRVLSKVSRYQHAGTELAVDIQPLVDRDIVALPDGDEIGRYHNLELYLKLIDNGRPDELLNKSDTILTDKRAAALNVTPSWAVLSRSPITDPTSNVWPRYINRHAIAHGSHNTKAKGAEGQQLGKGM